MKFETQQWIVRESAVFHTVRARWGAFSNFHASPLVVAGVRIQTAEALYQAMRYVNLPDLQRAIIEAPTAKDAKSIARDALDRSRPDWSERKVAIMRWVLRVKAQQWPSLRHTLGASGAMPIVEMSYRDAFWGARPRPTWGKSQSDYLFGRNVLGRLLMELRDTPGGSFEAIEPPEADDQYPALLYGKPIGVTRPEQPGLF